jgi:gamma-glutamyl:cysteine ligase YbdK (ATP-grasp superfamily)
MSDYGLFSVIGIEIEYMLVDKDSLQVQPKSDVLLQTLAGKQVNEVSMGDIALSNELVLHVIEFKNNGPKPLDAPLAQHFQQAIQNLQPFLDKENLTLLPSGAHPWMDPHKETFRWPHGNHAIYEQYDKVFNCKGHGWSNLQSMHINLPFADEQEFFQLHSAIRLLLPLLPALSASSPFLEGRATGMLDNRLHFYEDNQKQIPAISGLVIPEFIHSVDEYHKDILQPMYRAISPWDPEGILQHEWLNSRAAIPKFQLNAVEIRIVDTQEYINGDIAIAKATAAILQNWLENSDYFLKHPYDTSKLKALYDQTRKNGLQVPVYDSELKKQWQLSTSAKNCKQVWSQLIERISTKLDDPSQKALEHILSSGNLSERLLKATKNQSLHGVYQELVNSLKSNHAFHV